MTVTHNCRLPDPNSFEVGDGPVKCFACPKTFICTENGWLRVDPDAILVSEISDV